MPKEALQNSSEPTTKEHWTNFFLLVLFSVMLSIWPASHTIKDPWQADNQLFWMMFKFFSISNLFLCFGLSYTIKFRKEKGTFKYLIGVLLRAAAATVLSYGATLIALFFLFMVCYGSMESGSNWC